jgi:anti-sigma factor RsiW
MDKSFNIYELSDEDRAALEAETFKPFNEANEARTAELREDVARLNGYLKGRADSDAPKRGPGANKDLAG